MTSQTKLAVYERNGGNTAPVPFCKMQDKCRAQEGRILLAWKTSLFFSEKYTNGLCCWHFEYGLTFSLLIKPLKTHIQFVYLSFYLPFYLLVHYCMYILTDWYLMIYKTQHNTTQNTNKQTKQNKNKNKQKNKKTKRYAILDRRRMTCSVSYSCVTIWWPIYISHGFSAHPFNVK